MNKYQIYLNKLEELSNSELPLDGIIEFAIKNYEAVGYKAYHGRYRPNGSGGYAETNKIYGTKLCFDDDYSWISNNQDRKDKHNMYYEGKLLIPKEIHKSDIGRVVACFQNPKKWLQHLAKDYANRVCDYLQWLPTELGTNYSSGAEFFITKEHDGYWLWNTNHQIRLALFSTEDKAKEYAEHLRTI